MSKTRGRPSSRAGLWRLAGIVAALLPLCRGIASEAEDPGRAWRDGPPRYLLSEEEAGQYGRLDSPEQRKGFVERFWDGLDPDPSTPPNEFRDRFERLREEADRRFQGVYGPGWRTDRGRVLILLGEPDLVRREAGDTREIWTYLRPPPGAGDPPLEIVFFRDWLGDYRIRGEGAEPDTVRDAVAVLKERQRERQLVRQYSPHRTPIMVEGLGDIVFRRESAGVDWLPAPRSVRSARRQQSGSAAVPTGRTPGFDMWNDVYFFQAQGGRILTMLSVAFLPGAGADRPEDPRSTHPSAFSAAAWVVAQGEQAGERKPRPARVTILDPRDGRGPDGRLFFTGQLHLEPGSYEIRFAVESRDRQSLAVRTESLEVPDLPRDQFSASSIVPAERFGPASLSRSPYAVGSEEVVPRPGRSFSRGETLRIYLQVYGAAADPRHGRPNVDVTYDFYRIATRRLKRHGKPLSVRGAEGASMGLALPIGDWPIGDYRVVVRLQDRVTGARAWTEGAFHVAD